MIHNERGAVLFVVLICCAIFILLITNVTLDLIQHREMIQMRMKQLQATQLVQNGISYIQECIRMHIPFNESSIEVVYPNGLVNISIMEQTEHFLYVRMTAYEHNGGIQTYDVRIDKTTNEVIVFEKWGMSN